MPVSSYYRDIVAFAESEYLLPDTKRPIKLFDHQKRLLREMFRRDAAGKFAYDTLIYSCPKKSGKTEVGGMIAAWLALTEGPYAEIYTPANDLEQSQSRVFRAVGRAIAANPRLSDVKQTKDAITFPDGSYINTVASDYAGAAGVNPTASIWDELWGYSSESSERLWDEFTQSPTRLNSIRVIVTYAGFIGESTLLESLYKRAISGERHPDFPDLPVWTAGRMFAYWDTEPRLPWQTPEYYESQAAELRPGAFRRLHRNEWVTSESRFIEPEQWDAITDPELQPLQPGERVNLHVGADMGTKRDTAAVAGVYWDKQTRRLKLGVVAIWKPPKGGELDVDGTVGEYLRRLKRNNRIRRVRYDPSQFVAIAQQLRASGIRMEEFTQTPNNLTEAATALWEHLTHKTLTVFPDDGLREHALNATLTESTRGYKLSKQTGSRKIDALAALSFAVLSATEEGMVTAADSIRLGDEADMERIRANRALDDDLPVTWQGAGGPPPERPPEEPLTHCVELVRGHHFATDQWQREFNWPDGATRNWVGATLAGQLLHPDMQSKFRLVTVKEGAMT